MHHGRQPTSTYDDEGCVVVDRINQKTQRLSFNDVAVHTCVMVSASTPQGSMMAVEFCSSCMRTAPPWYASSAQMPDPPRKYDRSLIAGTAFCKAAKAGVSDDPDKEHQMQHVGRLPGVHTTPRRFLGRGGGG